MAKLLIIGGAGMIGQKPRHPHCQCGGMDVDVSELLLHDLIAAAQPAADFPIQSLTGNIGRCGGSTAAGCPASGYFSSGGDCVRGCGEELRQGLGY
ncbi:MAG: hypothetical protein R3E89_13815 [Thiolinea sp.]